MHFENCLQLDEAGSPQAAFILSDNKKKLKRIPKWLLI
jgi:hypothetical protein